MTEAIGGIQDAQGQSDWAEASGVADCGIQPLHSRPSTLAEASWRTAGVSPSPLLGAYSGIPSWRLGEVLLNPVRIEICWI